MDYLQYYNKAKSAYQHSEMVLNLVINGLPSIPSSCLLISSFNFCFKPCYKWITFNTYKKIIELSIDGSFKPCYKWITFNTLAESIV